MYEIMYIHITYSICCGSHLCFEDANRGRFSFLFNIYEIVVVLNLNRQKGVRSIHVYTWTKVKQHLYFVVDIEILHKKVSG